MGPSSEQIKSAVRTLLASLGSALAGYVIAKGWVSAAEANAILSNQQFMDTATTTVLALLGAGVSAGAGIWGLIVHKQANAVAVVAGMPEVKKVELTSTPAGVDLSNAVSPVAGGVVVVSGTRPGVVS
jgi:hypothetical protein